MRLKDLILTYDIGTSGGKCTLFLNDGTELASTTIHYETLFPKPGWAEQRPADYWNSVIEGTRNIVQQSGIKASDISIIGLSGQMNGNIPVNSKGDPLNNNIIHSDTRSIKECGYISDIIPEEESFKITGNRITPFFSVPKMLWLKNNCPEVYHKTSYFLNSKDYIAFRLTGSLGYTDYSDASFCSLDINLKKWPENYLQSIGLDISKFPQILRSFDLVGTLKKESAKILELISGIPVVMGGGDAACATRGAGVCDATAAYNYIGSSSWIATLHTSPVMDMRMQNVYDLDGELCNICGTVQSAGAAIDWAIENIAREDIEAYKESGKDLFLTVEKAASTSPIGANGVFFLPYLMGERSPIFDNNARGVFMGLSLYNKRNDLLRSVYEGVAYALRSVLDVYEDCQLSVEKLILIGGGVNSSFWNEILCNVYRRQTIVHKFPTGATSLGAAIAAAVGAGIFTDFRTACSNMVSLERTFIPDENSIQQYDKLYNIYKKMYPILKPIFEDLP
jgi:xylulokinase